MFRWKRGEGVPLWEWCALVVPVTALIYVIVRYLQT